MGSRRRGVGRSVSGQTLVGTPMSAMRRKHRWASSVGLAAHGTRSIFSLRVAPQPGQGWYALGCLWDGFATFTGLAEAGQSQVGLFFRRSQPFRLCSGRQQLAATGTPVTYVADLASICHRCLLQLQIRDSSWAGEKKERNKEEKTTTAAAVPHRCHEVQCQALASL